MKMFLAVWALIMAVAGCAESNPLPTIDGISRNETPRALTDFTLVNHESTEFHMNQLKGDYVLVAFGYTYCPDVCPLTLANYKQIKRLLGDQANKLAFVFVGVDVDRDTPERLKEYLAMFDGAFVGITGEDATLQLMIEEYGGRYLVKDYGGLRKNYTVDHTASMFLLNREGEWVRTYEYGVDFVDIAEDLKRVLQ